MLIDILFKFNQPETFYNSKFIFLEVEIPKTCNVENIVVSSA